MPLHKPALDFRPRFTTCSLVAITALVIAGPLFADDPPTECETPTVQLSDGDNQTGIRNTVFENPLVVHATCAGGSGLGDAAVTFSASSGGVAEYSDDDSDTTVTVYTDSDGYAAAYFFAPDDPGVTITVSATVETATSSASTSFVANTDADSDHDGVPDVDDGWYLSPQLTTPPAPEANYIIIDLGEGVPHGMNNLNEVVGERIGGADYMHEAFLFRLGQAPISLGFLTDDPSVPNVHKKSIAYAINDDGIITGEATYSWDPNVSGDYPDPPIYPILNTYNDGTGYSRDNYDTHAFRWSNGVMADAKDLSWSLPPSSDHPDISNKGTSLGWAINNSGTIVGTSDYDVETGGGGWYWLIQTQGPHAASFPGGTDPMDINMSTYYSEAYGINDFGAIVGYCSGDETVDDRAFLLDGNTLEFLGEPRSGAYGIAINNWYHAIGDFGVGGYNSLYADDSLHIPPIGAPARRGYEGRRSTTRQVTMDNGTPADHVVDLEAMADEQGYYSSLAVAINDNDQVIGNSNHIPVLWQNSRIRRLQDLVGDSTDWQLWDAVAINQDGAIAVGGYKTIDYVGHVLLLLPIRLIDIKDPADSADDQIIAPWDSNRQVQSKNIAWIQSHSSAQDATPRMPQLELRVPGLPSGVALEAKLEVRYDRGNGARIARDQAEDDVKIPTDGSFTVVQAGGWQIWQEYQEQTFFGGDAVLTYKLTSAGNDIFGPESIQFRIGGRNPDDERCRNYVESLLDAGPTGDLWFAYAIARSESMDYNGQGSRYNQFIESSGPNLGRPLWGNDGGTTPGGYGMFQVTGNASDENANIPRQQIWNWQENVGGGRAILADKQGAAVSWMTQQKNANNANGTALPDHTVGTVIFAEIGTHTMTDAVTIKLYNGASRAPSGFVDDGDVPGFRLDPQGSGHYCFWRNISNEWALNRFNDPPDPIQPFNYVARVCSEVEN